MKKLNLIWMVSIFSSIAAFSEFGWAVDLGTLDATFSQDGSSDGWDWSGEMDFHRYGSDVIVDSQGRIIIAGTYLYDFNGNTQLGARVERRLSNGQLDTSFDGDGIKQLNLPPSGQNQFEYELQLNGSDGFFVGYSRLYCITDNDCESDLYIYHINSSGAIIDSQQIDFDLGVSNDRKDDDFADMVYISSINKLAITAEVELTNPNDTDFGIALLDVDPVTGALSIDSTFSVDGKATCFFDHEDLLGSRDKAEAIVWDPIQNHFIVGGSTFEGNGFGADGWNMSFCEFDLLGNMVRKWSTESDPENLDDREFLADMQFVNMAGESTILVAGALPGSGDLDAAITRYSLNQISGWNRDVNFGSNGNGYEFTGFLFPFEGDTKDSAQELLIEEDGAILLLSSMSWGGGGGPAHGALGLSKYTANGVLDTNWGVAKTGKAVHVFDLSVLWDVPQAVAINPTTEEIYVTGFSYDGVDFKSFIANMHNDSIFGSNFDF
jgi:hypothetical protein